MAEASESLKAPPETGSGEHIWSRRDLISLGAWGGILTCFGIASLALLRLMFPRVLFEPPTAFKAGLPTEYTVGEVSTKWMKDQRTWIVREKDGFYAILGVCTHLGCTPRWLAPEDKFKCPCHGSGFRRSGVNFEGPAPRPLERVKIELADDGQLLIDKAKRYRQELGQWSDPGAFLKFSA
jgi:cytochrome b6-f complex iron-sulfur subunit